MVRFPSQVISSISFPSFKKTNKQTNKQTQQKRKKNMVEASASVFLILATALTF